MAAQKRNRSLIVVGILAYVVFLLALFPINIAYKLVEPKGLPVSVEALSGTLWNGEAIVKQRDLGRLDLNWELSPLSLLVGQVSAKVDVKSQKANLKGAVNASASGVVEISDTKGFVSADLVNQFIRRQRASLAGDFELMGLNLIYDVNAKHAESASGRLIWQGGQVNYPMGRKKKSATMPMLVADLGADNGNLTANVVTTEGEQLGQANLKNDGWAGVAIKRRLVDLAGEKWPGKGGADSTIFEVSEKVF